MSIRECAPTVVERPETKGPFVLRSFEQDESYAIANDTVVGRELDCAVCLQFSKVSRYHAKFVVAGNSLHVEDLQSSNGTYINGKRIITRTLISIGDEITFGDQRYRMTTESAGHSEATQLFVPSGIKPQNNTGGSLFQPSLVPSEPAAQRPNAALQPAAAFQQPQQPAERATIESGREETSTRLYSPGQIMSMAQRNLDHHADLDVGSGPRFVILTAPLRGQVCSIGLPEAGSSLSVGRDKDCNLCIPEASISRHHATITYSGLQFHIDSSHASNELFINGELQSSSAILRHGDKVQLGRIDALFRTDVKREPPAAAKTPGLQTYHKWLIAGIAVAACGLIAAALFLS